MTEPVSDDPRPAVRRRRWVEVAAFCLVAVTLAATLRVALANPVLQGDTNGVVIGAQHAVDCLGHGVFTHCHTWTATKTPGLSPRETGAYVGPWPVMQYITAVPLRWFGVSQEQTLRTLIVLDALALGVLFAVAWITVRRLCAAVWAPTLAAVLLTGPLLWYGTSAFGEALGATLVVCAVSAVLLHARPWIVATLVAAASLTKETNPAFLAVLIALCLLLELGSTPAPRWTRRILPSAIGVVAGVIVNSAFNVFRFGSVRNTIYLEPSLHVPDSGIAARAFVEQWFAPNGGILWFWPAAVALLGLTAVGSIRGLRRAPRSWAQVVPLGVVALLVVEIVGLATWFSPFGWYAWGPRLTLTLLPAMLLIACVAGNGHATSMLRRALASRVFWIGAILMVLAGLPQSAVVYQPHAVAQFFGSVDAECPSDAHIGSNPDAYYRCTSFIAWHRRPYLLERGLDGLDHRGGRLIVAAGAGATIALLLAARARARAARDDEPGSRSRAKYARRLGERAAPAP